MGTSTNRRGIRPITPLVPDWINDIDKEEEDDSNEPDASDDKETEDVPPQPSEDELSPDSAPEGDDLSAPTKRFDSSQRSFRKAMRTGEVADISRAIKNYYRQGLGGSRLAAKRLQSSSRAVARLGSILSDIQERGLADVLTQYNLGQYTNRPAVEVLSALMGAVCGVSSLLDDAVTKYAYTQAVVRIADENPDLDLNTLTSDQVAETMAVFLEESLVYRLICDVGRTLTEATADPAQAIQTEEQLSQIVSGLIRSTIVPELQKTSQDKATINRELHRIYRIAIKTILDS